MRIAGGTSRPSPSLSRRRGTRGGRGGGVVGVGVGVDGLPTSKTALSALGALCTSVFALGVILGARAVIAGDDLGRGLRGWREGGAGSGGGGAAGAEGVVDVEGGADDRKDDVQDGKDDRRAAANENSHNAAGAFAVPPPLNANKPDFPESYMGKFVPDGHDFSSFEPEGGDRFAEWKDGKTPYAITSDLIRRSDGVARSRREYVKKAMRHAWGGYRKYAFGQDEVLPQSAKGRNVWGGMGTTLVDGLDMLWLMGMEEEFAEARDWVRDELDHSRVHGVVSLFETTIRSLGGLLSAYDWSGDSVFLEKADELGSRLVKAFDTTSGIPFGNVDLGSGRGSNSAVGRNNAVLSEFATLQVEFRFLAHATGKTVYAAKSERVFDILKEIEPSDGLYPLYLRNNLARPAFANQKVSFGAMGDSLYEYMLKIWLQGGRRESSYRDMYDRSMEGMHDKLLQKSTPSGLAYIADLTGKTLDHKMDHLVCFMGGLLALGAHTDPQGLDSERAQRDLKTAKAFTYTCYQMYARMKTGLSPEWVRFGDGGDDFVPGAPYYILRPEAVESFYVLNQLTGDPIYREWGWEVFQSIERYCKMKVAYGSLRDVGKPGRESEDGMESFFLAETMKYLYLLFDPDSEVDILNKHMFNTEAHPMRIFPEFDKSPLARPGLLGRLWGGCKS